jgi:membrane-bound inhibitor of C-type lysozyme
MRAHILQACTIAAIGCQATASPLRVPDIEVQPLLTVEYRCGRTPLQVRYINASNGQSFALLRIDGTMRLFVQTLAASGVRYQADRYVWWSKGNEGNLYDLTHGDNAPPLLADCQARNNGDS